MKMASPVPAEVDHIIEEDLQRAGIKLPGFDSEDDFEADNDEFDDEEDEELQHKTEKPPKHQTGNKYMKGSIFKGKLDELIKAGHLEANDPVVKLLYEYGFNQLPDWDSSTAQGLQEAVASALAACCDFKDDVDMKDLNPSERGLAECVDVYRKMSTGGVVSSALRPVLEKLSLQQWARQLFKYIRDQRWQKVFEHDLKELPDITQYLSHEPLPKERGVYVAMLIAKDHTQHNHLYPGSGFGQGGVRSRQLDRQAIFDGKESPGSFFERLMCQKDPITQEHVRHFPVWGSPMLIPETEFARYTRAVFMVALGHLFEAVVALRLGGYDDRVKTPGVQALCRSGLGLKSTLQPWWGTLQHSPLLDGILIPWPEEMREALRKAYKAQYYHDNRDRILAAASAKHANNRDRILAGFRAKYAQLAGTFPCEADPGCNRTFSDASRARRHADVCRGQLEHECSHRCGASFDSLEGMHKHARYTCKFSNLRTILFCPRGCGTKFSSSHGARNHADSPICIYFDGEDLVGIPCPLGCSKTFARPAGAVRHANSGTCPRHTIALAAVVKGGEAVLVPRAEQARELNLPEVHGDRDLEQIKSFLLGLGEDEDMFRQYVDAYGRGGMEELIGQFTRAAEVDDN